MTAVFSVAKLPDDFHRWADLLDLITSSFAYMDEVIDPPSSAKLLTLGSLKAKAATENVYLATDGKMLSGCIFCAARTDALYIGKLAVAKELQGQTIGRALIRRAEKLARELGLSALELETRVELTGNHAAFAKLGFVETARTSHAGYDRHTSITMRKALR